MNNQPHALEPQVNTPKPILNIGEAAFYTRISKRLMWDLIAKGEIKSVRIGRRVLLRKQDIDDYLESKVI